jgi:exodeoxyribonuclease V beta subunit
MSNYRAESKTSGRADQERLAEDIRLFYVALTRAQRALWLGVSQVSGDVDGKKPEAKSALSVLLGRSAPDDLSQRLALWACADIAIQTAPPAHDAVYAPRDPAKASKGALPTRRVMRRNWWSASFSALTRDLDSAFAVASERDDRVADAQLDAVVADEIPPEALVPPELFAPEIRFNAFPAGASYGTLLHDLLQWQAEHHWPASREAVEPDELAEERLRSAWKVQLARAGQRAHLSDEQHILLDEWVTKILVTNWPLSLVKQADKAINLGLIGAPGQPSSCWPEMGFTLPVQRLSSGWLDQQIGQHLWPDQPRVVLQPRTLEGLLTGFIDLVLELNGRYYVLDYKSNRLPDYLPASLQAATLAHRYDVQAVLYVLALHRLLKSRLPNYDFDQHMGGALYWFVRGVDQPGAGLLALNPPRVLIEALDKALSQPVAEGAHP